LQQVEEAGKNGYRILNSDSDNHGDIGEKALDLSYQSGTSTTTGAIADYSTAMGAGTTAEGKYSTAMGRNTSATGRNSTAMGDYTTAESYGQTTIGMNNTVVTGDADDFQAEDRLFVIGNGYPDKLPSNALVILKNGNTTLNGALTIHDPTDTTGTSSYTLPTKKGTADQVLTMLDATTGTTTWTTPGGGGSSGNLEKVVEGGNTGYRILGSDPNFHGDIGEKALDLSYQSATSTTTGATGDFSTAMGKGTTASGYASTAMGYYTTASGGSSTAMGNRTYASGDYSTAMGYITIAKGDYSTAMGVNTRATGDFSTAMGDNTTAESFGQITIGMYNTTLAGSTTVFDANDRLFVIGNGESSTKESDALVILKNGDTRLNGALTVSGTISTPGTLHHPGYVFERYYEGVSEYNKSYSLPSLSEIEVFVKANKHLPGVQSRSDIKEKGSWNVTENVRTNLEKVEELYLHAIAQEKKIDAQSKVIEQLILRLDALEKKE
jgi:hypothetical protein